MRNSWLCVIFQRERWDLRYTYCLWCDYADLEDCFTFVNGYLLPKLRQSCKISHDLLESKENWYSYFLFLWESSTKIAFWKPVQLDWCHCHLIRRNEEDLGMPKYSHNLSRSPSTIPGPFLNISIVFDKISAKDWRLIGN